MDHDSVPLDIASPTSHRIADVNRASVRFVRQGLRALHREITSSPTYESNIDGHFAWDISLAIRAACLGWRVTGDTALLEHAASWANHMVDRTDEATGCSDWRGVRAPVWSAGTRYNAGSVIVGETGGAPIRLQAAADHVVIERPTPTTAVVYALRDNGGSWRSPEASLLPDSSAYLPDVLARRSASYSVLIRGLPSAVDLTHLAAGEFDVAPARATHLVHTGLISRSLLAAADVLEATGPRPVHTDITPEDLYGAAERALLHHDSELRITRGRAWYITPEDFPGRRLGLELPHNQIVDAATSLLLLGRRRKDEELTHLGVSMTRRFLGEVEAYIAGTLRHPWHYYPVDSDVYSGVVRESPVSERESPAVPRVEDSSHATMRVRALGEWRAIDPSLAPDHAMAAVALSFRRHFMSRSGGTPTLRWLAGDGPGAPRRGGADTYAGAWGTLAPWDSSIKRRINSMAYRHPPTSPFGATVLSCAEILGMNNGETTCVY